MALLEQTEGHYRFIPAGPGSPYCSGVVAAPGYEVVHATLRRSLPWQEGFTFVESYLASIERPRGSLCAVELRAPRPYTPDRWTGPGSFNQGYIDLLKSWGLFVGAENPVARTNVAPGLNPPSEQVLFAFSYTIPLA
ncbi:MAG: 2-amino-5-chloromuconate deaminase CnbZ, partial [Chloroflexota bacterium]